MTYLQLSHTLESNNGKMLAGLGTFLSQATVEGKDQLASGALVSLTVISFSPNDYCGLEISDEPCEEQMGSLIHPLQLSLLSG